MESWAVPIITKMKWISVAKKSMWLIAFGYSNVKNGVRTIAPEEICPWDNCNHGLLPPGQLPPRIIASGELPKDNRPLTISPWKFPPRKIAFRMICRLHNCSDENCPHPGKIVPRINYIQNIFFPRIRNRSTFIDSCILLFFFFVV